MAIHKQDILDREDIVKIMDRFYNRLLEDPKMSYIFKEVAQINLKSHLPIICDFWDQVLFQKGKYRRNVMQIHLDLNRKHALEMEHFEIWIKTLNEIVDELYQGEKADLMKVRALSIGTMMQVKISRSKD